MLSFIDQNSEIFIFLKDFVDENTLWDEDILLFWDGPVRYCTGVGK